MRIVYKHGEGDVLARAHGLEPAGNARHGFQTLLDAVERQADRERKPHGTHCVEHGEQTGNGQIHAAVAHGRMQIELYAAGRDVDVCRGKIRAVAHAEGQDRDGETLHDAVGVGIVHVDDSLLGVQEEDLLRGEVVVKGFMVIQVILREIRKQRNVELDAVDAELLERVGRDFHHDKIDARVRHRAQQTEQVYGFGRGAVGVKALLADHVADRADDADFLARMLCDRLQHVGRGGLAVRAGDAEHLHLTLRVSVEGCGHFGHGLSCVFDDDLRYGKRQFVLREQSDGARFDRGFRKGMSVEKLADDAAEHAPLLHLS